MSETLDLYKSELGYSDYDLMQIMRIGQKDYNSWFGEKPKKVVTLWAEKRNP